MPQEFLASFAVDIDEAGVSRLQSVLEQNRSLAEEVAAAFSAARVTRGRFCCHILEAIRTVPLLRRRRQERNKYA